MLVLLQPRLDGSVDPTATVHLAGNLLVSHRVARINRGTVRLNHLRLRVATRRDEHMTRVAVVRLERLLVDLLLAATVAAQLAVVLDHAHDGLSVLFPLLQRHRGVALHELTKPRVILRHDELAVVRGAFFAGSLVDLFLGFSEVGERQTHIGQENDFGHDNYLSVITKATRAGIRQRVLPRLR